MQHETQRLDRTQILQRDADKNPLLGQGQATWAQPIAPRGAGGVLGKYYRITANLRASQGRSPCPKDKSEIGNRGHNNSKAAPANSNGAAIVTGGVRMEISPVLSATHQAHFCRSTR